MTHKIIQLAIDALLAIRPLANRRQFNTDVSEAIKALTKVKKYL
jgi:hypothetical protein